MATTPDQPEEQLLAPVNALTDADATDATDAADHDRPVRILVQTKTHLVPGDKSTGFGKHIDRMVNLICHHVWQRDYDRLREREWTYGCEFAFDNRPCWFLIDHHGPDPDPIPDPPVVRYTWTGTDFVLVQDPLPHRVRRELRHYPFIRRTAAQLNPPRIREPMPPRKFRSHEEEMRHWREDLRRTLACGLTLLERHTKFVQEHPKHAEWVQARVPPEAWARLDDPSQFIQCKRVELAELGEEELLEIQQEDLRSTLACGLTLFERHAEFVQEHPKHAEWVKARVPLEAWARLEDLLQFIQYKRVEAGEEESPVPLNSPDGPDSESEAPVSILVRSTE